MKMGFISPYMGTVVQFSHLETGNMNQLYYIRLTNVLPCTFNDLGNLTLSGESGTARDKVNELQLC